MYTSQQTYKLPAGGSVRIEQRKGGVKVSAWDQPTVTVTAWSAEETNPAERLSVGVDSRGLRVEVTPRKGGFLGFLGMEPPLDLELRIPFGTAITLEAGSGSVEIIGTRAPVRIESGSGKIALAEVQSVRIESGSGMVTVQRVNGSVNIESGSGMVEVVQINGSARLEVGSGKVAARQITGTLTVENGSGTVAVADVAGEVRLENGSGPIRVERARGAGLHVETGSGEVELTGIAVERMEVESASGQVRAELVDIMPGGSYKIESASGGVMVAVPPDAGLSVVVDTEGDRVSYSGLNLHVTHHESGELRAMLNGGGARLYIDADGGGVQLLPAAAGPAPAPAEPEPLLRVIRQDAALETSEHIRRVLAMVEEGKLSPEEAEEILRALDEEEIRHER